MINKLKSELSKMKRPLNVLIPYVIFYNTAVFKEGRDLLGFAVIGTIAAVIVTIREHSGLAYAAFIIFMAEISIHLILRY